MLMKSQPLYKQTEQILELQTYIHKYFSDTHQALYNMLNTKRNGYFLQNNYMIKKQFV